MLTRSKFLSCGLLLPLCILLFAVVSCESKGVYVGTYKADEKDSPRHVETTLELKANGQGIWKVGDEEVPFSWYIKQDQLRLNTKGGGVILGTFDDGTLNITLPNYGMMSFKRSS
jgi:hypothetical protein